MFFLSLHQYNAETIKAFLLFFCSLFKTILMKLFIFFTFFYFSFLVLANVFLQITNHLFSNNFNKVKNSTFCSCLVTPLFISASSTRNGFSLGKEKDKNHQKCPRATTINLRPPTTRRATSNNNSKMTLPPSVHASIPSPTTAAYPFWKSNSTENTLSKQNPKLQKNSVVSK